MTDLATLGFRIDTAGLKGGADALDQFGAKAKAAGAAVEQGAGAAKVGTTATGIYAKTVNEAANAHGQFTTQGMAAFHAARSMAEGMAMGIPPAQMLAMQMNHLSYAASGPGGIAGAFGEVGKMIVGMITPMRLLISGVAAAAVGTYLLYESAKSDALQFADLQDTIGGTVTQLHALKDAAYFKGGVSQGDFFSGMEKFGSLVVEAQHGLGSMAELFRANGVAISKDLNVNLAHAADLISNAASQQEKYRLVVQLGLPPTQQWIQFLSQGGDAILRASQEANGFGDRAEQQMVAKARDFDTAWAHVWQSFKDHAKSAVVDVVEYIKSTLGGGVDWLVEKFRQLSALSGDSKGTMLRWYGSQLTQNQANNFYDGIFGRGKGPGGSAQTGGGATTVNPQDAAHALQIEQQHISILGQLATVQEQVRAKEIAIQQARLQGVPITKAEEQAILSYTRAQATGLLAIQQQTDAARIQAATIGMTTGEAQAYAAVMSKVYEQERLGHPLDAQTIANLKQQAAAMGGYIDAAERANFELGVLKGVSQDTLSGIQHGKTVWESFGQAGVNALNKIASKLMDMAIDNLWANAFPGGGGFNFIGAIASLFSGGGGVLPGGAPLGHGGIGHNAGGTDNWGGGLTWVGEKGPELVNLPRGSQVIPNNRVGGQSLSISAPISVDARGSSKDDAEAIASAIERRITARIVPVVKDAFARGAIR